MLTLEYILVIAFCFLVCYLVFKYGFYKGFGIIIILLLPFGILIVTLIGGIKVFNARDN